MLFTRCISSVISSKIDLHIRDHKIIYVDTFKLLSVLIDRELNFSNHALHICKLLKGNVRLYHKKISFQPEIQKDPIYIIDNESF